MTTIVKEKIVFDEKIIIEEGKLIDDHDKKYKRQRINRQDAACVFILNTESNKYILTKQFRYGIASKTTENILEIVAGKVDKNEEPINAAIRETNEETGYVIEPDAIQLLTSCFVSPGYSSERFYIYYGTVTNASKKHKGGGKKEEHENIEVIEMEVNEFNELIKNGGIKDAKTLLAATLTKAL